MAPSHAAPDNRLSTLGALLDETDAALRRGAPATARVWPTGFTLIDQSLSGGVRSGDLVLVGGRHGQGKTTLALQFARNTVASGGSAVVFSYEHEAQALLERLISLEAAEAAGESGLTVQAVRRALEQAPAGISLVDLVGELPGGQAAMTAVAAYRDRLQVHESSGAATSIDEIARTVDLVRERDGMPPMVVVDYLQKVPVADGGDESRQITAVVEGLKDLALEFGAPVIAVSAADKASLGAGHRMRTHDLRGSSALAYEADVVLIISDKQDVVSRDHLVYDLGNIDRFRAWSIVSLEKNRHGPGHVEMEFPKDFEHGRFHTRGGLVTERLIEERIFTT